jgi:hypothetical protein
MAAGPADLVLEEVSGWRGVSDLLSGSAAVDVLVGGNGLDRLRGGSGADFQRQ